MYDTHQGMLQFLQHPLMIYLCKYIFKVLQEIKMFISQFLTFYIYYTTKSHFFQAL